MRALFVLVSMFVWTAQISAAQLYVIDGDTLEIDGVIYRVEGIDAPEIGQICASRGGGSWPCGLDARDALLNLVRATNLDCVGSAVDALGRRIATCHLGQLDVGAYLISRGLAWTTTEGTDRYVGVELGAQSRYQGIWQAPTIPAKVYREELWAAAASVRPIGCPVKGTITDDGARVYHVPWSPLYTSLRVEITKGERFFCSEPEALAAGWTAPRWK